MLSQGLLTTKSTMFTSVFTAILIVQVFLKRFHEKERSENIFRLNTRLETTILFNNNMYDIVVLRKKLMVVKL